MIAATDRRRGNESGFAVLVLLAVVGIGSIGLLLAVEALVPTLGDRGARADHNLTVAADAARLAYRRNGSFPVDLDALAVAAGLDDQGVWRVDPFGAGQEIDYQLLATNARIRSRGRDGQLTTGDDVQVDIGAETQLRLRQRLRLRMLRAVLTRSAYRLAGSMSAAEEGNMRDAMSDFAIAKRSWLTASVAERVTLATQMSTAQTTIDGLVALHGCPPLPPSITGAGGLMGQLGMPDSRAFDGRGVALATESTLGWLALGADGVGGSDDDM